MRNDDMSCPFHTPILFPPHKAYSDQRKVAITLEKIYEVDITKRGIEM